MFRRMSEIFRHFMYGRYGSDQLNNALLVTAIALSILNSILSVLFVRGVMVMAVITPILSVLIYAMLFYGIFRIFSRNIYKRRRENQKFLNLWNRLRDRDHRYFHCPQCKQMVRVPKNRGKINIRCPKCGEKFIKKT